LDEVVIVDAVTGKEVQKFVIGEKNIFSEERDNIRFRRALIKLELDQYDFLNSAKFSPDGKTLLTASNYAVQIWDVTTGKVVKTFTISIESIENEYLEKLQELFDKTSDNSFKLKNDPDLDGEHEISILSRPLGVLKVDFALFSPDGKTVITGDGTGVVRIWDVETGKELKKFGGGYCTEDSISFSPDSKTVVIAVDEEVYICNLNMIRQHLEQKE
jgi:WD40 repeat protein